MNPISVLVTKDPTSLEVSLFKVDPKEARKLASLDKRGMTAYIEGIADLDNSHFLTKNEIQSLTEKVTNTRLTFPPRNRVVAAKDLVYAIQANLNNVPTYKPAQDNFPCRVFPPSTVITPCRKNTKLALLIQLLHKGTTMSEMREVLGWKVDSIHTGLNWDLNKRKGFGYKVTKIENVEVFSLVIPGHYKGPIVV